MKPSAKAKWHAETKKFFRTTHAEWDYPDDEERVLCATCENLDMFWRATEQLDSEGLTFTTETGQVKKHPATEIQKTAWAGFLAGCRLLGICSKQSEEPKRGPGRPPGPPAAFGGPYGEE